MKRVLYWIGLLMIAGLVLMPDVVISPFASDSQALAQDSGGQTASEQQYEIIVPPESISSECRLWRTTPNGEKYYECSKDASEETAGWEEGCYLIVHPNGAQSAVCASITEPKDPQRGSQSSPQEIRQQPAQRCQLLRVDPDGTEVSECGDQILYKYPDGSLAVMSPRESQQDGGQQDGGQQGTDQRSDGGQQQDGGQQREDGQQGASRQGYGCALLE
jgi:hypothetical protein